MKTNHKTLEKKRKYMREYAKKYDLEKLRDVFVEIMLPIQQNVKEECRKILLMKEEQ